MRIQNINNKQPFQAHGAKHIGHVMNKLYDTAYGRVNWQDAPDIIQVSAKMLDGTNVTAVASFEKGKYVSLTLPYEQAHYRSEFCRNIIQKFNEVVTKGKANKK